MNALVLTLFISACLVLGAVILFLAMSSGEELEHHLTISIKPLRDEEAAVATDNEPDTTKKGHLHV